MAERTRRRASGGSSRSRAEEPQGRLSRDYSNEEYREPDVGYDGPEPTRGLYTCELVRVQDHTSQDGNESVRWLFRLAEGSINADGEDVSGWMDSQYTNDNTAWREQQMLVAMGVIKPKGKLNLTYDGIVKKAKQCTVRVGTERYIDDDGEAHNRGRMQAFLPLRESTAERRGITKRSKDDDEGEDVFDDEEEGDDEDEEDEPEEAPPARSRRSSRRKPDPEPEPEDEEDEEEGEGDEEEDYDPDTLAAELEDLSLVALKKRAKEEFGVTIKKGMTADDIIEAVLDTLGEDDEDDDEEEEEEPPPPPKRATRAKAGTKPTTTRRKRGSSEEPPF